MSLKRTPPSTPSSSRIPAAPAPALALPATSLQQHAGSDSALETITMRSKRKFISEEEISMRAFMEEIKNMFDVFTDTQDRKLISIQGSVSVIKEQNDEIAKSLDFLSQKYDEMREEINCFKKEQNETKKYISLLENKIELLERKSRSNEVEIRNIPIPTGPETSQDLHKSLQRICSAIGISIGDGEIKALHRINTKVESNKPILIDLTSASCKNRLLTGFKTYNAQHPSNKLSTKQLRISGPERRIFVSESLTFNARKLFRMARDFAAENKYRFCWTSHGIVYLRQSEGSRALKITSEDDIPKIEKVLK